VLPAEPATVASVSVVFVYVSTYVHICKLAFLQTFWLGVGLV